MDAEISDSDFSRSRSSSLSRDSSDAGRPGIPVGRGRGRGRGRARRPRGFRGRGNRGQNDRANRADLAAQSIEERNVQVQDRINRMSEDERAVMLTACRRQPTFVFNLLEHQSERDPPQPPENGQPEWCTCTFCREMPDGEKVCCKETPSRCHSRLPDFTTTVLDELVLEVAARYRNDVLAQPADPDYCRNRRHTGYRQYILCRHGYLGAGNRRVVPSCCVWRIRDKYPDINGHYVGFQPGRLG